MNKARRARSVPSLMRRSALARWVGLLAFAWLVSQPRLYAAPETLAAAAERPLGAPPNP